MQFTSAQFEIISASAFLVTGGAGFIGSHIAEFLLTAGARKVRILDNLSTGHFRNVAPFANHPRFEYMKGDLRDMDKCKTACQGMDYVFHLAGGAAYYNVNLSDFLNLLVVAHEAKIKRLVYASGPPIYGESEPGLKVENAFAPDAVTRYINELYAEVFSRHYGMETIGLRYCNVYGQRQQLQSEHAAIIPNLVMQLHRHETPEIDAIDKCLDFNYIDDVVRANILAMLTTHPNAVDQVYNIAPQEKTSLFQLAVYLREFLSVFDEQIGCIEIGNAGLVNETYLPDANSVKEKELLGYEPKISLRNGLLKSISWYWAYLPQFSAEAAEKKQSNFSATAISV